MSFSRCLAVLSVVASGGFSSPSIYLVQVLFRNEVECRASGSSTCAHLYVGVDDDPHPSYCSSAWRSRISWRAFSVRAWLARPLTVGSRNPSWRVRRTRSLARLSEIPPHCSASCV